MSETDRRYWATMARAMDAGEVKGYEYRGGTNYRRASFVAPHHTAMNVRHGEKLGGLGSLEGKYGGAFYQQSYAYTDSASYRNKVLGATTSAGSYSKYMGAGSEHSVISGTGATSLAETFSKFVSADTLLNTVGGTSFRFGPGDEGVAAYSNIQADAGNYEEALQLEMSTREAYTNAFFA